MPLEKAQAVPQPARFIAPPAPLARGRLRHLVLALSFILCVLIPAGVTERYLWRWAADQYASHLGFSVRKEENSSAIELLGGITDLSGSSTSDTDILFRFLTSQELVRTIDDAVDLRSIWSRVPIGLDPVFAFDTSGSIEDLVAHWERKVSIVYDSTSGMLDLRVLAFDPQDAQAIAAAIFSESSEMINNLTAIAREDTIKYAREDLDRSMERLKQARLAMNSFRNRTQVVDPTIDAQSQMGLLNTLQQQLAAALIDLDLLRDTTRNSDQRILQAERRVEVIQARIDAERQNLGLGEASAQGDVFADIVGEYEALAVDLEFAQQGYVVSLAAYDASVADARRQSRYLAAHISPTLAERPQYPERFKLLALITGFLLLGWAFCVLIYYSLRDRR